MHSPQHSPNRRKGDKPILMVDLNPTHAQLSAVLFNRLQAVTTSTANTMVLSADGNGCEAWRLLNHYYNPQTDQRLTKSIMDVINFKITGKEIQGGIIEWEQLVSSLTKDHAIKLDPKLLRAFLMNILPKWMYGKVLEHLDRLPTYAEVREKVISLSQNQGGEPPVQQVDTQPTPWGPTGYDEASGYNWQWVDNPVGLPPQDGMSTPDEGVPDINALTGPCYNCGGTGYVSRNCPSPPKEPRGKAPKGGGKGKTGKAGKTGKGGDPRWCPTCNKSGHTPES